jgi:orotate phosphoribosyltransferase
MSRLVLCDAAGLAEVRAAVARSILPVPTLVSSGRTVSYFVNGHRIALERAALAVIGRGIAALAAREDALALVGEETACIPFCVAATLSDADGASELSASYLRKQARSTGEWTSTLPHHTRVVIVDDVAATGAALLRVIARARATGVDVAAAVVAVDREEGAHDALSRLGVPLHSFIRMSDLAGAVGGACGGPAAEARVLALLKAEFAVNSATLSSRLDELGVDSLQLLQLANTVEDEFQVEMSAEDIESLQTMGDIVAVLASKGCL